MLQVFTQFASLIFIVKNCRFDECKKNTQLGLRTNLESQSKTLEELLSQQTSSTLLLNNTVELGEKLYPTTSPEGGEIITNQIQELQQALEALFDGLNNLHRDIKAKQERWAGFDERVENITSWLKEAELKIPQEIELKASLDEKQAQLQVYRNLLHDASSHQQDIVDLKETVDSLPEKNKKVNKQLVDIIEKHSQLLNRIKSFVNQYEIIVNDHQQYNKAIEDVHDWIDTTHDTATALGDTELERITLQANLERLKVCYFFIAQSYHF